MKGEKRRLKKLPLTLIIITAVAVLICASLLIANLYVPLKYLSAYTVKADDRQEGELRVTFLDVGFGDCAVAELPDGKVMLIDCGDGSYPSDLAVLKYLNSRKIYCIDYLVCTSVKDEHCGGFAEILKYKSVKKAFIPKSDNPAITEAFYGFKDALDGCCDDINFACVGSGAVCGGDCFFTFLSPSSVGSPQSEYAIMNASATSKNIDNASAIVWLQYGGTAFSFLSDIRADALKRVTEEYELFKLLNQPFCSFGGKSVKLEDCKITTVAGHGAEANLYDAWYDCTKPEQAVVSVGKNFAGCPAAVALSAAYAYCKPIYTQYSGNITFKVTADGYSVVKEK